MSDKIYSVNYESPLGNLQITGDDNAIHSILFDKTAGEDAAGLKSPVIKNCQTQLDEFFTGKRKTFELPLSPSGTDFQKSVWSALQNIPFGKTISYLELAIRIGDEKSVRAVGAANGKNPVAIVIPCHRVIGMNHKLVGYAGGLWRKQWLLEHEEKYEKGVLRLF